jgi:hypothetical protein
MPVVHISAPCLDYVLDMRGMLNLPFGHYRVINKTAMNKLENAYEYSFVMVRQRLDTVDI